MAHISILNVQCPNDKLMAFTGGNIKTCSNLTKMANRLPLDIEVARRAKDICWVARSEQINAVSKNISGSNEFGRDIARKNHQWQYLVITPHISFGYRFRHSGILKSLYLVITQAFADILNDFQHRCDSKLQCRGCDSSTSRQLTSASPLSRRRKPNGSNQRADRPNRSSPSGKVGGGSWRKTVKRRTEKTKEVACAGGGQIAASIFKYFHKEIITC